jgi:AcrR family transcriptional regulator
MARPSTAAARREELLPTLARTFAETGYRRATTAELALRCGVPENTLYRLWQDKKRMFLESIDHLYATTVAVWETRLAKQGSRRSSAVELLDYEGTHYGEHGFYRIIFAGLSEIDDPDIRKALRQMYRQFHRFIAGHIADHRKSTCLRGGNIVELLAWAVLGMGTVSGIGRELGLISRKQQQDLFSDVGKALLRI